MDGLATVKPVGHSDASTRRRDRRLRHNAKLMQRIAMRSGEHEPTPEGYRRHVITSVTRQGDNLTIEYGGRISRYITLAELPPASRENILTGHGRHRSHPHRRDRQTWARSLIF